MKIETNTATLNYEVDGPQDSPSVLLWNGAQCTLRMWDFVIERLRHDYRFIRFDIRGTGASHCKAGQAPFFSLEQYSDDANLILDQLNIDQVIVWSMAWGSRAAIAYCSQNADRVTNAVLNDSSIAKADPDAQKKGAKEAVEKQLSNGIKKFEKPYGYNINPDPDLVGQALAAAGRFDLGLAIKKMSMPVLLVTGDHDPNLISSKEINAALPNSSLKILKDVGHGSVLQRPDLCADEFQTFQEHQKIER